MENIVIGIEGTVGSGKTSICRNLLNKIDNSIILHGGEIYRAIVYGMMKSKIKNTQNLDAFEMMKELGIEIKLEDTETKIYMNGEQIDEKDLQSKQAYNIILSSRDIVKMYPDVTYHFFVDASIEERTNRKYNQYNKEMPKEQIREMIQNRDELQEKSGYYKIYPQTKVIDVTSCKNAEESAKLVLENMKETIVNGV